MPWSFLLPQIGGKTSPVATTSRRVSAPPFLSASRNGLKLTEADRLDRIPPPAASADDDVKQEIARKIIDLAKAGERNPDVLCEQALKDIRREDV
jgi:hypothetical protein